MDNRAGRHCIFTKTRRHKSETKQRERREENDGRNRKKEKELRDDLSKALSVGEKNAQEVCDIKRRVSTAEASLKDVMLSQDKFTSDVDRLKNSLTAMQETLSRTKGDTERIESQTNDRCEYILSQVTAMSGTTKTHSREIRNICQEADDIGLQIRSLKEPKDTLRASLRSQIKSTKDRLRSVESQSEDTATQLAGTARSVTALRERVDNAIKAKRGIAKSLEAHESSVRDIQGNSSTGTKSVTQQVGESPKQASRDYRDVLRHGSPVEEERDRQSQNEAHNSPKTVRLETSDRTSDKPHVTDSTKSHIPARPLSPCATTRPLSSGATTRSTSAVYGEAQAAEEDPNNAQFIPGRTSQRGSNRQARQVNSRPSNNKHSLVAYQTAPTELKYYLGNIEASVTEQIIRRFVQDQCIDLKNCRDDPQ